MLNLRLTRGPLGEAENRSILGEYNRLTGAEIPMEEFAHWVQASPAGAAWHALLETDDGQIVGHTSVFPLRVGYGGGQLVPVKSEYSFVHEDFRKEKIRGFETVSRPTFLILLDRLFQHAQEQGWGPIFASTNEKNQVFTRKVGLRPLEFPLWECLLVLRPANAARHTPNLNRKHRAALFAAGVAQATGWSVAGPLLRNGNPIRTVPLGEEALAPELERLSFFEDAPSLSWRYQEQQYLRYSVEGGTGEYLIAKRGSPQRYLRVCQYRLDSPKPTLPLVQKMIAQAKTDGAIGVRWAVYEQLQSEKQIVGILRKLGFLCARRVRIVMVHKNFPQFLSPDAWRMNDSHFTYDP